MPTVAKSFILSAPDAAAALLQKLPRPVHLLVAVSGGSDSTGLLVALAEHRAPGIDVSAATVDHGLRPGSAAEALAVGQFCARLNIPHKILDWTGDKPKTGLSAAAREARYALLCSAAEEAGATAIVSGHTIDDQRETIAMRSARAGGASVAGLSGMAEAVLLHRRHWLLRPFLRTRRSGIRDFLCQTGHGWFDDPSNADPRYERVRTRAMLASVEAGRPEEAVEAGERRRRLSEAAAKLLGEQARVDHAVLMHLQPAALAGNAAVLRYALSAAAAVMGGREQGPGSDSLDRVMEAVAAGRLERLTAGRVVFDLRRDGLFLCRESRRLPEITLAAGESCLWDERFHVVQNDTEPGHVGPMQIDRQAAQALFPDVPVSIAQRASRALPTALQAAPVLAPYHRFLPQFDYELAVTLASLVGCDTFPLPPWNDSWRKR
ncbi:MAG: tRNA lysidine(34) synthetase TilS [Pseudorhizobium sp.]